MSKQQQPFINLVATILTAQKQNPQSDTSALEHEIDVMPVPHFFSAGVYHLYGLSYEEAKVIDGELREEEFEKYKLSEL